jgi:hypothetical protein
VRCEEVPNSWGARRGGGSVSPRPVGHPRAVGSHPPPGLALIHTFRGAARRVVGGRAVCRFSPAPVPRDGRRACCFFRAMGPRRGCGRTQTGAWIRVSGQPPGAVDPCGRGRADSCSPADCDALRLRPSLLLRIRVLGVEYLFFHPRPPLFSHQ